MSNIKNTLIFGAFLAVMAFVGTFAGSAITTAMTGESPVQIVMRWREEGTRNAGKTTDEDGTANQQQVGAKGQPGGEDYINGLEPANTDIADSGQDATLPTPKAPSKPEAENYINSENADDSVSNGFTLMFGELLDANPNGGIDGNTLVVKAKINGQITNELTIKQNYHNIEDLVKKQGADQFNCIDYWAVADMTNGEEQKVVAFTVSSETIKGIAEGNIVAIQLEDYVDDLFIHQSLKV